MQEIMLEMLFVVHCLAAQQYLWHNKILIIMDYVSETLKWWFSLNATA